MTKEIAEHKEIGIAALDKTEAYAMLRNSLYPGASDQSIDLVMAYCTAHQLDIMQKPAHIVPMWNKTTESMQDVVMPGVGLYRTQAARSGEYGGVSKPIFGPLMTANLDGVQIEYPEWCEVTVIRHHKDGFNAEFVAKEYWLENYATKRRNTAEPNQMWRKRIYGQLAKCAEAQALRKAFPEIGAQPTAEEMEGKDYEEIKTVNTEPEATATVATSATDNQAPAAEAEVVEGDLLPEYPEEKFKANLSLWVDLVNSKKKTAQAVLNTVQSNWTLTKKQKDEFLSYVS